MDQPTNDAASLPASATAKALPAGLADAPLVSHALFRIGDKVKHRVFGFRGVVFDADPVFANSEDWYESNPLQPDRNQPFYHLLADNGEESYVAYVSQQNLMMDDGVEPIDHPGIEMMFKRLPDGDYKLDARRWN
jgi:heat shock protein HspQ